MLVIAYLEIPTESPLVRSLFAKLVAETSNAIIHKPVKPNYYYEIKLIVL